MTSHIYLKFFKMFFNILYRFYCLTDSFLESSTTRYFVKIFFPF